MKAQEELNYCYQEKHNFKLIMRYILLSKKKKLLSFHDIRRNGYHLKTTIEGNIEYPYIMSIILGKECIMNMLPTFSSGLYYTYINKIKTYAVNQEFTSYSTFIV